MINTFLHDLFFHMELLSLTPSKTHNDLYVIRKQKWKFVSFCASNNNEHLITSWQLFSEYSGVKIIIGTSLCNRNPWKFCTIIFFYRDTLKHGWNSLRLLKKFPGSRIFNIILKLYLIFKWYLTVRRLFLSI